MVSLRAGRAIGVFAVVVVAGCSSFSGAGAAMEGDLAPTQVSANTTVTTIAPSTPPGETADAGPDASEEPDASSDSAAPPFDAGPPNLYAANGDFEKNCSVGVMTNGALAPTASSTAHGGTKSCQFCGPGTAQSPWAVWLPLVHPTAAGDSFHVKGWIHAPMSGTSAQQIAMRFNVTDLANTTLGAPIDSAVLPDIDAQWQPFEFDAVAPVAGAKIRIDFNSFVAGSGCFLIDDIVVTKTN